MIEASVVLLLGALLIWTAVFWPDLCRAWKHWRLRHKFFHHTGGYDLLAVLGLLAALLIVCGVIWGKS